MELFENALQIKLEGFENADFTYQSNRSLNIPPDIPRAFDVFSCPGEREFDELSLPLGGSFDH